jgi:signal transduction histidine kinase
MPGATERAPAPAARRARRDDAEELLRQRETLRRVVEEMSSELELRPLLTGIVRHACELLDADDGSIGLYDPDRDLFRTEAVYRMPPSELGSEMPPGAGLAGLVLAQRRPVVAERYGSLAGATLPELADNAVVGVPIVWRDRLIGCFGVGAPPPRRFDAADVETLALFARHAAVAIHNARRYESERRRTERLSMLAKTARVIAAGLELDELLQNAADAIHELLGYPNVAVARVDPADPEVLTIRTLGGSYRELIEGEHRLPIHSGILGAAARERRTVLVNDVESDPRWVPTPGATGICAELAVPILLGGRILGVLNVESAAPFTDEDAAALEIAADHLAVAIQNAELHDRARRLAVVEERQRLARELHDSVTQLLFSASLIAQSVTPAFSRDRAEGEQRVARLLDLNRRALAEMRALLRELRPAEPEPADASAGGAAGAASGAGETPAGPPAPLTSGERVQRDGLVPALAAHLAEIEETEGLATRLEHRRWRRQPPEIEEPLFRIAQEALHNAVKHAGAERLRVHLSVAGGAARLRVIDDGSGFDAAATLRDALAEPRPDGGLGLVGIRERALALDGAMRVDSRPGRGTRIEVTVPLPAGGGAADGEAR